MKYIWYNICKEVKDMNKKSVIVYNKETGEVLYSCNNWRECVSMQRVFYFMGLKTNIRYVN
jgi:hypothetical protein